MSLQNKSICQEQKKDENKIKLNQRTKLKDVNNNPII